MTPRPSRVGEERALKALWKEVFGDSDEYIDTFFREVYHPGMASGIEENGEIAAAAYAVCGRTSPDKNRTAASVSARSGYTESSAVIFFYPYEH